MKSIAAILALASSAAAFAPQTQSTVSQVTMTNSGSNGIPIGASVRKELVSFTFL